MIALPILAAVAFVLLAYPFIIYPFILLLLPKRPIELPQTPEGSLPEAGPSVALVFAARNEESAVPEKLKNIRELRTYFSHLEVHAYSDCSTDRTLELLESAKDLIHVHAATERTGKAAGMRLLANSTDAEILICTDANVLMDPVSVGRILKYFGDPSVGSVAGTLHYTNGKESSTTRVGDLYWRFEEWIKKLESRTGSTVGADGSMFAIRRSLYPEVPQHLLDDLIVSLSPALSGYRAVSAADVHAYERSADQLSDELRRKRRIACRAFATYRFLAPRLRNLNLVTRFKFYSHRVIRPFSGVWLICFLAAVLTTVGWYVGTAAAVTLGLSGVVLLLVGNVTEVPVLSTLTHAVVLLVAVSVGVGEALMGREYGMWEPPASR